MWFLVCDKTYTAATLVYRDEEPIDIQFLPPPLIEEQRIVREKEQMAVEHTKQIATMEARMEARMAEFEKLLKQKT